MDLSKLSKGEQLFVGGSLLYVISSFFNWFKIDLGPLGSQGANGFDVGFGWCTLWFILLLLGAASLLLPMFGVDVPKLPAIAYLAVGALAALFAVLKLLIGIEGLDRGIGLFLAVIASLIAAFGGFLKFKESGGSLDDLKDMNKIKSALNDKD